MAITTVILPYNLDKSKYIGAVHKVCHAIFDDFWPPSFCHKLSQILDPPKSMSHFWTKSLQANIENGDYLK